MKVNFRTEKASYFPMIAILLAGVALHGGALLCPVTGEPVAADSKMVDVNGIRFRFCCPSCIEGFKKDPMGLLKKAAEKGWTVGVGVFDPVSGRRLTPETARGGTSDFKGVRYGFLNGQNKTDFDSEPKKYGLVPDKWCSICPVMQLELAHTYGASGYVDVDGVRYFSCCEQCFPKLRSNPAAFVGNGALRIGEPKPFDVPSVWGKLSGPGS